MITKHSLGFILAQAESNFLYVYKDFDCIQIYII